MNRRGGCNAAVERLVGVFMASCSASAECVGPECEPCATGHGGIRGFGFRIGIAAALAGQGMVFNLGYNTALADGDAPEYGSIVYWALHGALLAAALGVMALLGGPLLSQLWRALRERRVSVEAMFVISALGALVGSLISTITGQGAVYYEVVAVVVCVYAIGKQISAYQRGRVGAALAGLRDTFAFATVEDAAGDGRRRIAVGEVVAGTIVHIEPGDPVPVDGSIVEGSGFLREAAFTGEPGPVARQAGQRVLAGTWSLDASLRVRAEAGRRRSLDQLMGMVEQAASRPSNLQQEADAVMRWFVPVVSGIALLTFGGWWLVGDIPWWRALFHSMAVLLVACPCAFGLATPAGIWAALYQLSQRGLTARNGQLVDALASCSDIVFDKTGTLTEMDLGARPEWSGTVPLAAEELAAAVASLSCHSQHPVNAGLASLSAQRLPVYDFRLHPGCGISGKVAGQQLQVGSYTWLRDCGVSGVPGADTDAADAGPKRVYVALDGTYCGAVVLSERLRAGAASVVEALQQQGCRCHILSGDPQPALQEIGGLPVRANISPQEKARYCMQLKERGGRVLFIGDGVNDVVAMQAASAAIAIDTGSALATEFADGCLADGRLDPIPGAIHLSRKLKQRLRGNLHFALTYNAVGVTLAAAGLLHPVVAALLMVGSSVIVSLRGMRAL